MTHNPVAPSGPWSLGVLIGTPATALGVLLLLAAAGLLILIWHKMSPSMQKSDRLFYFGWAAALVAMAPVLLGIYAFCMWPFNSEYHQWRAVHGTVQQVSSRLIASDKSMSQRFVVQIDGQDFGVDDTRASLLHEGDQVSLRCKRDYQFQSQSGWVCNWN